MRPAIIFILLQLSVIQLYSQCGEGEIILLDSQTKVDNFLDDYCTDFKGNLQIFDDNDGQDNIVSLDPLLSITNIDGVLGITSNPNLESIEWTGFSFPPSPNPHTQQFHQKPCYDI